MKTILVPIDSKKEGDLVVKKALEIASVFDSNIHLVHVTPHKKQKGEEEPDLNYITGENLSDYEKEMDALNQQKFKFRKKGIFCEAHLLRGKPSDQILKLANKIHADLIIIGLIEHGAFYKVFIGSTSNNVIKGTKIPVMLIPPEK